MTGFSRKLGAKLVVNEFEGFPKIPRLNKPVVINEKIDGTNGAVVVDDEPLLGNWRPVRLGGGVVVHIESRSHLVYAQSRKRIVTPKDDNYGFAAWVWEHAQELTDVLGPGRHFGEWWGHGIQRGYGLPRGERRFSLFNVKRWRDLLPHDVDGSDVPGLRTVPTLLIRNGFGHVDEAIGYLRENGSVAAPGFMNPEGVVVYHAATNQLFKAFVEDDDKPKSVATQLSAAVQASMDRRN